MYIKQCAAPSAIRLRSIDHSKVLNVVFPDGRYVLSEKDTDYIMPEAMFLSSLGILIPDRAQWNGEVLQGQRGTSICADGSKLSGGVGAGVFARELGFELHFRLKYYGTCFTQRFSQS